MTRYFNSRVLCLGLAVTVLVAAGVSANAQPQAASAGVQVNFADLDLDHPTGADVLLKRIEQAAAAACGGEPSARLETQRLAFQRCRDGAVGQAVGQINAPLVTAAAMTDARPGRAVAR